MGQYYSRVCGYKLSFEPWNDKFDQRTYLKYCNGAETFYSYDPQRRRLQNLTVNSGGNTIMDNAYTYDAIYRLVSATGTYTGADNNTASNDPNARNKFFKVGHGK